MNPYGNSSFNSPSSHASSLLPSSASGRCDDLHDPPLSSSSSPPVIHTDHSSISVLRQNLGSYRASSDQDGGQNLVPSKSSALQLPGSNPDFSNGATVQSVTTSVSSSVPDFTVNPYLEPGTPPSHQVSVIMPSPDLHPSPLQTQCSEEGCPDLECSICFSQFNNVFRCPKMLQCKHTFCLECLARINVKSTEPSAIQCPLCRSFTPLPNLGLPKLATDSNILSSLPAAMQRVYSIRFLRSKGKLEVKRASEGQRRWPRESLTSMRSIHRSLDVGVPSSATDSRSEQGMTRTLFRLTGQPACRAFLLTSVVMMMVLLTGIIIFLLTAKSTSK